MTASKIEAHLQDCLKRFRKTFKGRNAERAYNLITMQDTMHMDAFYYKKESPTKHQELLKTSRRLKRLLNKYYTLEEQDLVLELEEVRMVLDNKELFESIGATITQK